MARACVEAGAHVFLCARDSERLEQTQTELASQAPVGQRVFAQVCDVSDPNDVLLLVESARRALPRLDGLVNNAGVCGPTGLTEDVEWKAWKRAIEINLMGPVLLCRAVVPIFRKQGYGKIVNLSGGGAAAPRPCFTAYAVSKAAVVRFTETLAEETRGTGVDVNAISPGALNTRLLDEVLAAGPAAVGHDFYARALKQKEQGGVPLEKGAALCTYLLSSASDGITGRLISAVWDPWETLHQRRHELEGSDIYTLRRIVPKDRGLSWG